VDNAYNGTGALTKSKFHDLEITKQVNGLGIKKYAFVTINDSIIWDGVGTSGRAVQFGQTTSSNINQGSEARCRNVQVYGNDLAGSAARYAAGFWIEDCDAVELEGCGTGAIAGSGCVIQANASGHSPSNHFFYGCIFDATDTGHCLHMTGGGNILNVKVNATWFASAGQMVGTSNGNGLRFDAAAWAGGEISGCNFYNTRGTGLFIDTSAAGITVTGNTFSSCGLGNVAGNNDGIYVDVDLSAPGPVICGNFEGGGAPGSSIKTSSTANRLVITGNAGLAGTDYGSAPNVNANNGS
jgi:parallel beta-helix repeat protein